MDNLELKKLHLENRISLLSAKPIENAKLIKKVKRQLRALQSK